MRSTALSANRKIPICYVIASVTTDRAGTERHLLRLIRALDRTRFDPLLVVLQQSDWTSRFDDPRVPMQVLGFCSFWRPRDWRCVGRLAGVLRGHGTRVVELHYPDAHLLGSLAARLAAVPAIIACRRDAADYYGWKELTYCRLGGLLTDCYLANSREVVRSVSRIESLAPSRFEVIHNGLDLEQFDRAAGQPLPEPFLAATKGKRLVVLAANLRPVKNIPLFLDAARLVLRAVDDVVFTLLGSGPEEHRLKQRARELGIAEQVVWTGAVPETAPYLRRASVACLTSDSEGFSNALIEYMAAGLPVVATRVGGAAEAVLDGETGFLTAKGNAEQLAVRIIELLQAPSLSRRLGAAGRRRVEQHFSIAHAVDEYQQLYERLAGSPTGAPLNPRRLELARRG